LSKLKIGIIGGGFGLKVIRESTLLNDSEIELMAGLYGRRFALNKTSSMIFGEKIYKESEDFRRNNDLNMIIVAVPPHQQLQTIMKVGKPGIYLICEKPGGKDIEETIKIVNFCSENRIKLFFGLQFRYEKGIQELKKIITEIDEEVIEIEVKWILNKKNIKDSWKNEIDTRIELSHDLGLHVLDYIAYLLKTEISKMKIKQCKNLYSVEEEEFILRGKLGSSKIQINMSKSIKNAKNLHQIIIKYKNSELNWVHEEPFTLNEQKIIFNKNGLSNQMLFEGHDVLNRDSRILAYRNMLKSISNDSDKRNPKYFIDLKEKLNEI
jgi:predicted dehydrogenase